MFWWFAGRNASAIVQRQPRRKWAQARIASLRANVIVAFRTGVGALEKKAGGRVLPQSRCDRPVM